MNSLRGFAAFACLVACLVAQSETTSWRGHERRELPIGDRRAFVVVPRRAAAGRPWIWRARFFGHEPQVDLALLARGFHLVYADVADLYGNRAALQAWDATYRHVTKALHLSPKVALECMSRGGLTAYRWATANPDAVACIYADAPVCDIKSWPAGQGRGRGSAASWQRCLAAHGLDAEAAKSWLGNPIDLLETLARARVPLLHVCGDADDVVPIDENTRVLERRYRALGGPIRVIVKPGVGHHPHSLADPAPIVAFILRHTVGSRDYFVLRGGLDRCRRRFVAARRGRVAFLGGSITHNPGWRDRVRADLKRRFKGVDLEFVNAGIPSFGSTPGAFRLQRDVLARGPVDLLFVEAAVNDAANGRTAAEVLRGMEGIVRHALRTNSAMDIVMMHFVDPAKMRQIDRGVLPPVIAIHERVAEHYQIASLDLATEVTERIAAGEFTWKDDFKNLHPSPFGQRLYAASIGRLLDAAWATPPKKRREPEPRPLPTPLDPAAYDNGHYVDVTSARSENGWSVDPRWVPDDGKGTRPGFVRVPMLVSQRRGAVLTLPFKGDAVGILVTAGPDAGVIEASVDGGPWGRRDLMTRWSGGLHLPWSHVLFAGLAPGPHELRLRLAEEQPRERRTPTARIAWFLVNRR